MAGADKFWAIIPAAGIGTRMQADVPKQYLKIRERCILDYTLEKFCSHTAVSGVVVALAAQDPWWTTLDHAGHAKIMLAEGGVERCHSVLNALHRLAQSASAQDWVLVHDAARPCLRTGDMEKLMETVVETKQGGLLAVPVRDTMKRSNGRQHVAETVEREGLWHALTPQMFRLGELSRAMEHALQQGKLVTDEAQAMEYGGTEALLVEGHPDNIKITHPRDLALASLYLSQQEDRT